MKSWFIAIRPKTLFASISPIIIALSFALSDGFFDAKITMFIFIGALSIQVGTNLVNDYFDFIKGIDHKNRKGSTKVLVEQTMTLQTLRKGIFFVFFVASLSSIYLILQGGWPIAIVAISSIACAILYSAGPYPLSHSGLAEPIEFIFFGPVAVGATYYLIAQKLPLYVILGGLIPAFLSLAILTIDNLRDEFPDKEAGKKTLCVRFGAFFTKMQYYICILSGFVMPIALVALTKKHFLCLSCLITLPLYKPALDAVKQNNDPDELNKALAKTAQALFLFSLIFSAGWLL